jgi:hypothetical protein
MLQPSTGEYIMYSIELTPEPPDISNGAYLEAKPLLYTILIHADSWVDKEITYEK